MSSAPATAPIAPVAPRRRTALLMVVGLALTLVLAGVVSFYASSSPDGLEKVSADHGLDANAQDSALDGSPLAGYGVSGIDNERVSVGVAGVVGVGVTFLVAAGAFFLVRRRATSPTS